MPTFLPDDAFCPASSEYYCRKSKMEPAQPPVMPPEGPSCQCQPSCACRPSCACEPSCECEPCCEDQPRCPKPAMPSAEPMPMPKPCPTYRIPEPPPLRLSAMAAPKAPRHEDPPVCNLERAITKEQLASHRDSAPYPPVCVREQNRGWAQLLAQPYAGPASEFTATSRYMYQSMVFERTHPQVTQSLQCIAQVEMDHLQTLGELICLLGGDPVIGAPGRRGFQWWNGTMPGYQRHVPTALRENIAAEQGAIRGYRQLCHKICDPYITAVLERIILDEELHIRIYEKLLADLTPKGR